MYAFGGYAVNAAFAQTLFDASPRTIRYESYNDPWQCASAVSRVEDSVISLNPIWRDTLPWEKGEANRPFPNVVVEVAKQCITPVIGSTDALSRLQRIQLLLIAGNRAVAESIVEREILGVTYDSIWRAMSAVTDLLRMYKAIPQVPVFPVDRMRKYMADHSFSPDRRMMILGLYLANAKLRDNDSLALELSNEIVALTGSSSGRDYDASELRVAIIEATIHKYKNELMDSLRIGGGAAYGRFYKSIFQPIIESGRINREQLDRIGNAAMPLEAIQWYPATPTHPVPAGGKPALIVFLGSESYMRTGGTRESHNFFATLRRLQTRFPNVDITLVWRTAGWFGHGPTVNVREEGKVVHDWLLEARKLPGRLAIDSTPYDVLPSFDERRIDAPSQNTMNYLTRDDVRRGDEIGVLVSPDNVILLKSNVRRESEHKFAELIEVMKQ